jgi:hypothetical protein
LGRWTKDKKAHRFGKDVVGVGNVSTQLRPDFEALQFGGFLPDLPNLRWVLLSP